MILMSIILFFLIHKFKYEWNQYFNLSSDLFTPKRNVLNNVTNFNKSPTMSSKSISSYKYSSNVRRESASESEFGGRRKNGLVIFFFY